MLKNERYFAKLHGDKFYFTGKACVNNHISKRYTSNKRCVDCADTQRAPAKPKKPKTREVVVHMTEMKPKVLDQIEKLILLGERLEENRAIQINNLAISKLFDELYSKV